MQPLSPAQQKSLASLLQYPLGEAGRAYLEKRGLAEVASSLRLGEVPSAPARAEHRRYAGRLVIPSFSARGTVVDMALRCMAHDDCGSTELWRDKDGNPRYCRKYEFMPGISKRLYGLDDIRNAGSTIHIAEGHPDRMTLKACGLHAVGVAGVNAWKDYHKRLFQGFETVYFWQQSDDNGQSAKLGERIRLGLSAVSVIMVSEGEDLNSFYVKHGKQAVLDLLDTGAGTDPAAPWGGAPQEGETEDDGQDDHPGADLGWDVVPSDPPPPF